MNQFTVDLRAEPGLADTLTVIENMRERDRAEIFATRYTDDPAKFAMDVTGTGAFRWGAYLDGRPVALIGAFPRWPNVWSVWAFGTDDWPHVVLTLTRHVRRFMLPAIYRSGAVRADCMALENHADARRWLESLGASAENRMDKWGKNGENFVCYVWTRNRASGLIRSGAHGN